MTTTSITSGTDFIGKTLVIGSTGTSNTDYARVVEFNNNTTGTYLGVMFSATGKQPWFTFRPLGQTYSEPVMPWISYINVYYIYVFSFVLDTKVKYNIYEYNGASTIISKGTIGTYTADSAFLQNLTQFWLGRNVWGNDFYSGTYSKVALYNGDLSAYAWNYEAGLIAQEVLQISDLSYVVGGGDYYEQKYNLITQTNEISYNYIEPSANNYELSNNYYDQSANYYYQSANNYELSNNYYDQSANYYEVSANYCHQSANNYEISYNLIAQAYNLNYNSVFVYGLAAIKELHAKVKAKEINILNRQAIINNLITRIEALESNNIL